MRIIGKYWCAAEMFALCAFDAFAAPPDPRQAYNQGVDWYRRGEYEHAAQSFRQALNTEDRLLEQWGSYNLGNALVEQAQKLAATNPAGAVNALKEALTYYRRAIETDSHNEDAKINYELAWRLAKQLEDLLKNQPAPQTNQGDEKNQRQDTAQGQGQASSPPGGQTPSEENSEPTPAPGSPPPDMRAADGGRSGDDRPESEKDQALAGARGEADKDAKKEMTPEQALMLLDAFERLDTAQQKAEQQRQESAVENDW
ncbi:MAG: hypothetical protein NC924_00920 [Candidatus Omnitrophica bacterium]|nr:hypothetical protein [Candidatus Omnitrophota bacterium]